MNGFLSQFDGTLTLDASTGAVVDDAQLAVDGKPEWWVEIRKTLDSGAFERAQRHLVGDMGIEAKASEDAEDAVMRQRSDVIGYQRELALGGIVDWNLTDKHGDPLPCSNRTDLAASLEKLPPYLYTAIHAEIARNNQPRTAKEKATFRDGGAARAEESGNGGASEPEEVLPGARDLG